MQKLVQPQMSPDPPKPPEKKPSPVRPWMGGLLIVGTFFPPDRGSPTTGLLIGREGFGASESSDPYATADDINPALPIIRNTP